jgi:hypothetical protein
VTGKNYEKDCLQGKSSGVNRLRGRRVLADQEVLADQGEADRNGRDQSQDGGRTARSSCEVPGQKVSVARVDHGHDPG